jgi:hypothetical protein
MPQNSSSKKKNCFLVFLDNFSYKNGPYIFFFYLRAFVYLFGSILGFPNDPKKQPEKSFCFFCSISSTRMGLLMLLGAYFQAAKTLSQTSCPNEPKKGTQRPARGQDVWPNIFV